MSAGEIRALLLSTKVERYKRSLVDLSREVLDYGDVGAVHRELEEIVKRNNGKQFKLALIPRGHLKTSFITIGYAIQRLLNDPNERILLTSATWDNARLFLKEIKGKIESEKFVKLFGEWKSDHWNQDDITIKARTNIYKEPSISTAGVEKSITGQHYNTIFMDDVVNRENVTTPEQVKKVISFFGSLLPILEPGGNIYVIGTRWDEFDLYGHIIKTLSTVFDVTVRRVIEDEKYIFPEKFNDNVINTLQLTMTARDFSAQYYNEPIASEETVFKPEWNRKWSYLKFEIEKCGAVPLPRDLNIYTTIDLARSETHDSDETAIVTCGWDKDNNCYILDVYHDRVNSQAKLDAIFAKYATFKPIKIGIETDAAQAYFLDILRWEMINRKINIPIEDVKSGGKNKEDRISNLEPLFRMGKIFLPAGSKDVALEEQLSRFTMHGTKGRDDILDALGMQLKMYIPAQENLKKESWAETQIKNNPDVVKDVTFIANAVRMQTEAYNKEKSERMASRDALDFFDSMVDTANYEENFY